MLHPVVTRGKLAGRQLTLAAQLVLLRECVAQLMQPKSLGMHSSWVLCTLA